MYLELENESHGHNVPKGSETHFRLIVVSAQFEGQSRVNRQRRVYELLADERSRGLHALALWTYTPDEWKKVETERDRSSPHCHGGKARS